MFCEQPFTFILYYFLSPFLASLVRIRGNFCHHHELAGKTGSGSRYCCCCCFPFLFYFTVEYPRQPVRADIETAEIQLWEKGEEELQLDILVLRCAHFIPSKIEQKV